MLYFEPLLQLGVYEIKKEKKKEKENLKCAQQPLCVFMSDQILFHHQASRSE